MQTFIRVPLQNQLLVTSADHIFGRGTRDIHHIVQVLLLLLLLGQERLGVVELFLKISVAALEADSLFEVFHSCEVIA